MYKIITKYDFIMSKRLQRNEFSNYRLQLNFIDHCSAMFQWAIIPKFANVLPALINNASKIHCVNINSVCKVKHIYILMRQE